MERMLTVLAENPTAAVAGFVAMVCFATWPFFRARRTMLTTYVGNNLGFAVHYALLGEWTAAAMNGLMGVQTVVAIMLVRQPRLRWAYYALMPVLALASVVTWHGLPSFLSAAATTLSTIGRMQTNERALRFLVLASTPFWAVHDLIVGSLPGLTADVLSMAIGATMLLRHSEVHILQGTVGDQTCIRSGRAAGASTAGRRVHPTRADSGVFYTFSLVTRIVRWGGWAKPSRRGVAVLAANGVSRTASPPAANFHRN